MADRIKVIVAVTRDDALPIDVQGVGLRRMAIDLMGEVAEVKESSVRYKGATEDATLDLGGDVGLMSTWQHNLIAALFTADGVANKEICGPVTHWDRERHVWSSAHIVRDEFS